MHYFLLVLSALFSAGCVRIHLSTSTCLMFCQCTSTIRVAYEYLTLIIELNFNNACRQSNELLRAFAVSRHTWSIVWRDSDRNASSSLTSLQHHGYGILNQHIFVRLIQAHRQSVRSLANGQICSWRQAQRPSSIVQPWKFASDMSNTAQNKAFRW